MTKGWIRWAAGLRDSTASKMRRASQIFRHFFNSKIIVLSVVSYWIAEVISDIHPCRYHLKYFNRSRSSSNDGVTEAQWHISPLAATRASSQ